MYSDRKSSSRNNGSANWIGESPARSGRFRGLSLSNPLDVYKNSPLRISKWRDLCAFSLVQREYRISFLLVILCMCRASHVQSITAGTPTTTISINYRHTTILGSDVELNYACYEDKDDVEKVQIDFSSFARNLKTSNGFPAHTLTNESRKKRCRKAEEKVFICCWLWKSSLNWHSKIAF